MRNYFVSLSCLIVAAGQLGAQTATFEGLPFNSATPNYENGKYLSGTAQYDPYSGNYKTSTFVSGGSTFNNTYNLDYSYWSGISYSKVTNVTTNVISNQYAAYNIPSSGPVGTGDNSATYAIVNSYYPGDARIILPENTRPGYMRVTNTTYTALAIRDGDPYGFGRPFVDGDYFKLIVLGFKGQNVPTGTAEIYLADYRNGQSFIRSEWSTLDLSTLLGPDTTYIDFDFVSTDMNANPNFGMNTPAYFAMDNFTVTPVPEPTSVGFVLAVSYLGFRRWKRKSQNRDNRPNR